MNDVFAFLTGSNGVMVNTTFNYGVNKNKFQLQAQNRGHVLGGIICEKSKI